MASVRARGAAELPQGLAARSCERPEAALEGGAVVVRRGGAGRKVEFKPIKAEEGVVVDASLYPALRALGVRAELEPEGVKPYGDGVWRLLATAVESTLRRGEKPATGRRVFAQGEDRGDRRIFQVEAEDGR